MLTIQMWAMMSPWPPALARSRGRGRGPSGSGRIGGVDERAVDSRDQLLVQEQQPELGEHRGNGDARCEQDDSATVRQTC